jgi:hypothetical protein
MYKNINLLKRWTKIKKKITMIVKILMKIMMIIKIKTKIIQNLKKTGIRIKIKNRQKYKNSK